MYIALVRELGERSLCGGEIGPREGELSIVVGRVNRRDEVALMHRLVIVDCHAFNISGNPRRKRSDVAGDIGVVRSLKSRGADPTIIVSGDIPN